MVQFLLQLAISSWSAIESQMTSVERILEYGNVKKENLDGGIVSSCAAKGHITFEDINFSYPIHQQLLFRNINLEIKPKDKLALAGRTGVGKTSLVSMLFRLYNYKGKILIDNVDIKSLSLKSLRSQISIMPQETIIFTGTVRENIDPFKKWSDNKLWKVLNSLKLQKYISSLDGFLNENNLSAGQKKLVCLARTIANKKKILILDEPAGNLDKACDLLFQQIIQDEFANSTVIVVTHNNLSKLHCNRFVTLCDDGILETQS